MASETVRIRMSCPKRTLRDPIIHALSHDCRVVPNILRGRITRKDAWLELELSGPPKNVAKALRFLERKGIRVRRLED